MHAFLLSVLAAVWMARPSYVVSTSLAIDYYELGSDNVPQYGTVEVFLCPEADWADAGSGRYNNVSYGIWFPRDFDIDIPSVGEFGCWTLHSLRHRDSFRQWIYLTVAGFAVQTDALHSPHMLLVDKNFADSLASNGCAFGPCMVQHEVNPDLPREIRVSNALTGVPCDDNGHVMPVTAYPMDFTWGGVRITNRARFPEFELCGHEVTFSREGYDSTLKGFVEYTIWPSSVHSIAGFVIEREICERICGKSCQVADFSPPPMNCNIIATFTKDLATNNTVHVATNRGHLPPDGFQSCHGVDWATPGLHYVAVSRLIRVQEGQNDVIQEDVIEDMCGRGIVLRNMVGQELTVPVLATQTVLTTTVDALWYGVSESACEHLCVVCTDRCMEVMEWRPTETPTTLPDFESSVYLTAEAIAFDECNIKMLACPPEHHHTILGPCGDVSDPCPAYFGMSEEECGTVWKLTHVDSFREVHVILVDHERVPVGSVAISHHGWTRLCPLNCEDLEYCTSVCALETEELPPFEQCACLKGATPSIKANSCDEACEKCVVVPGSANILHGQSYKIVVVATKLYKAAGIQARAVGVGIPTVLLLLVMAAA